MTPLQSEVLCVQSSNSFRKKKPPDRAKWAEVGGLTLRTEEAPQQGNVTISAFELYISNDRSEVSGRGSSRDRLEAVYEITC